MTVRSATPRRTSRRRSKPKRPPGSRSRRCSRPSTGRSPRPARDAVGAALTAGALITLTVNDPADTITIAVDTAGVDERARDAIGAALVGTGIDVTPSDVGDTITLAINTEYVQDIIGALLVGSTGINLVYNDAGNTLTVAVDTEAIQDIVGALIAAGTGMTVTYNDTGNVETVAVDTTVIATRTYVDNAVVGLLDLKGATDASANPNYPAASKGDLYVVSVAGKVGGVSGKPVDAGDTYFATADNAGGTEASVGTSWIVIEHNLSGVYVAGGSDVAITDGGTGASTATAAFDNLSGVSSAAFGRALNALVNAAALRTAAGLVIGTDVEAHDSDLTDIAALTPTDNDVMQRKAGHWTNRTLAQLLSDLGLTSVGILAKLTAGFTPALGSIDRWKSGTGKPGGNITRALTTGSLTTGLLDPLTTATTPRLQYIDDEIVYVPSVSAGRIVTDGVLNSTTALTSATAAFVSGDVGRLVVATGIPFGTYIEAVGSSTAVTLSQAATATASGVTVIFGPLLNLIRGEQGTTAAAHAASAEITRRRRRVVAVIGDSIVEGVQNNNSISNDPWIDRWHRASGDRYGGAIGKAWGNWRSIAGGGAHHESTIVGSVASVAGTTSEVGFGGTYAATQINGGTGNYYEWTRPGGEQVRAVDINIVDVGAASCAGSYSLDQGTTWVDFPLTTRYTSGTGILRSFRVACDNPTTIRIRAATAAGTSKTIVIPSMTIFTYATYPWPVTEGLSIFNFGWGGIKLRQTLNSRTATDAVVTNGSPTVTSATSAFVAADAGSTVYLNAVAYTILSRDSATQVTLTGNYAGTTATGVRITVFQGDHTGDRLASVFGHAGSVMPDLTLIGPCTNDQVATTPSLGDGNELAYYDNFTYLVGKAKASGSDVIVVAPYERDPSTSATSVVQAAYRAVLHTVATEQSVAIFDIYDLMAAQGATGYTAANAQGWYADGTHPSELGHQFLGARFADMLEFA
jgi:lysophospholipase L1-like esterase